MTPHDEHMCPATDTVNGNEGRAELDRDQNTASVLLVDDEPRVLAAYHRQLRGRFPILTATGADAAIEELRRSAPIAVIVSDLRMPGTDGLELLSQFRARSPDTVRLMLTGNADLSTAQAAVNHGQVFRFLTKPCEPDVLGGAIDDALTHYSLRRAEHDLLSNTLNGTVRLLSEMVSLVDGETQTLVPAIRDYMRHLCDTLGFASWEYDVAALLCQLGNLTLPPETSARLVEEPYPDDSTRELAARAATTTRVLLSEIPRLGDVGRIIGDSSDPPIIDTAEAIENPTAAGAVMLHLAIRWAQLTKHCADDSEPAVEIAAYAKNRGPFAQEVVANLVGQVRRPMISRQVGVNDLRTTMILEADIYRMDGVKLLRAGTPLTRPIIERISTFAATKGVTEPIHVLAPGS